MQDYESKYAGEEIDALLDRVSDKEIEIELVGTPQDKSSDNTIWGAKRYTEEYVKEHGGSGGGSGGGGENTTIVTPDALFYAGAIQAAYSISGTNGAQVTVSQAFRTKYNIGENKEVFYIVDKRMIAGDDSNAVYIYPADFEGCYFVMGDFEGNDAILDLGATAGDWVVVQGREWVKIATQQREIAGISGNVTAEALATKLSTPTLENTKPLATKEEILQSDWLDRDTASKAFVKNKPFGVIAQTPIIQLNLSADTIGTDISILSETSPFYVAGSVYYAKDVLDQDIVINTAGEALKVRVVKEGDNYYLRHISGRTQVEDIAFISNVKLQKLSSGYISDEIARAKDFYTKEEVDSKKQDTLSLTVKDNGNIVIGNINGQSKEFMPATPSGDPMHYAYEAAGAVWNNDTGFWEYRADEGGLTDLTNEDMKVCYAESWLNTCTISGGMFYRMLGRTTITNSNWSSATTWYNYGRGENLEVGFVCARGGNVKATPSAIAALFCNCPKLKRVIGKIDLLYCKSAFEIYNSPLLEEIIFVNLRSNVSIKHSSNISKASILGAINNSYPDLDSPITITVEASAYERLSADSDIIAALEAHPLVTLVSA